MTIALSWGCATDTGRQRPINQDALFARPPVFLVADGMGGHAAGEVAAACVVQTFESLLDGVEPTAEVVAQALADANTTIFDASRRDARMSGMGTTAVGLVALQQNGSEYWLAFNLGDSRLYRLFQGELQQVTVDHSYVQELVDQGRLASSEARRHPDRSVVTRAIGTGPDLQPDFWLFPPEDGERFLLCSDGLTSELEDATIRELLAAHDSPSAVASALVLAAVQAGGRDNVSAIVVEVATHPEGELGPDLPHGEIDEDTQDRPPVAGAAGSGGHAAG